MSKKDEVILRELYKKRDVFLTAELPTVFPSSCVVLKKFLYRHSFYSIEEYYEHNVKF